jgi:protein-tyrosine-phosphatase
LKKTYSVLFVCLGNTCRSPLAEVILKSELKLAGIKKVHVSSAGTGAFEGARASSGSTVIAGSKPLTRLRVRRADLVLTMTASQKREVRERWPEDADRVFTLSEYSGSGEGDVRDPVGGPLSTYQRCGDRLKADIKRIVPRLRRAVKAIR